MSVKIQLRRDTASNWANVNPTLAQGEMGVELDTNKFKFGNGTTAWNSLPYAGGGSGDIPTKLSQLSNDVGFITISDVEAKHYALQSELPTKTSQLTNDSNYITLTDVQNDGYTKNKGTVTSVNNTTPNAQGNVTIDIPDEVTETTVTNWGFTKNTGTVKSVNGNTPDANGNVTIEAGDGSVKTVNNVEPDANGNVTLNIPSKTSDLTNDSDFLTTTVASSTYIAKDEASEIITEIIEEEIKEKVIPLTATIELGTGFATFTEPSDYSTPITINTRWPGYCYSLFDVTDLEKVNIQTHWKSSDLNAIIFVFTDANNSPKSYTLYGNYTETTHTTISVNDTHIIVPDGATKLYVNVKTGDGDTTAPEVNKVEGGIDIEPDLSKVYIPNKEIKILFIGNSMMQDAMSYVPFILKNTIPTLDFTIYNWYHASYTLRQHLTDWQNNQPAQILAIAKNTATWSLTNNSAKMPDVLAAEKFDIIVLQEYFNNLNGDYTTDLFNAYDEVIQYIQDHTDYPFSLVELFHAPHRTNGNFNMDTIYTFTETCTKKILRETAAEALIPAGIAIYYACKDSDLNALGDTGGLSPDYVHTQEGFPCMIQSYVTTQWILDKLGAKISILNDQNKMTTAIYNTLNIPGPNLGSGVVTATEAQYRKAQRLVLQAMKIGKAIENEAFNSIEA